MDYNTEADLVADGFEVTPQAFHTGAGTGKVYEKVMNVEDESVRVYFSVDTEGKVALFKLDEESEEAVPVLVQDIVPPAQSDVVAVDAEAPIVVDEDVEPKIEPEV